MCVFIITVQFNFVNSIDYVIIKKAIFQLK